MLSPKIVTALLCVVFLSGCAMRPTRPNFYPALNYPYVTLAELYTCEVLKYEGKDIGLDGGSHVYIFSTQKKMKLELWNLCQNAKLEYGLNPRMNAFMLRTGTGKEDQYMVLPRSNLEKFLILVMSKDPEIPAGIVEGIKDRSHPIAY